MSQQPTAKPQQTKQQFQQSFAKAIAKQDAPPSAKGWGTVVTNPAQVTNVWSQAKTSAQAEPKVGPPTSGPGKGLTTVMLTPGQYATYQQWTGWAQKYKVPVSDIFARSPDFGTFTGFMAKLRSVRESPALGTSEQDMAAEVSSEVAAYLSEHGVSGASATWGGAATTATVPKTEEKKPASPTEVSADQPPWAGKPFAWGTTTKILKHLKDAQEAHEYPTTVPELKEYVADHAAEFKQRSPGVWQAPLEGMKTKVTGGGSDLKWWSIVVEVTAPGEGRIFHYGPEHLYK